MTNSIKSRFVALSLLAFFLGFVSAAQSAPPAPTQSFVGNYSGTYYDFTLWHTTATSLNGAGVINTTDMPWLGQGVVGSAWSDVARSYYSAGNGMNAGWVTGNGSLIPAYAINRFNNPVAFSTVDYGINGIYTSKIVANGSANWYMTATVVTGGATPLNNSALDGFILVSPSLTYSAGAGAPEIDGSLAPKVGLLFGCLYLVFGRKKQNAETGMIS